MRFVDTNILIYAVSTDAEDQEKATIANELLRARDLALSTQVLQEFYVQATRSTREHRLTHEQASDLVTAFTRFAVQDVTVELVLAAMSSRDRFGLSYWDAAIVEAARMMGCEELLSEDLSDGQAYGSVTVVDPFR